jgi:hypothetical protein
VVRGGSEEKVAAVVDPNTHGGSCEGEDGNGGSESAPRRMSAPWLGRPPSRGRQRRDWRRKGW